MLLKELVFKNKLKYKDIAKHLGITPEDMSRITNYVSLPTPDQADKLCDMLHCNILDIYNKKEIDLIKGTKKASRNQDEQLFYRLSVRLNKNDCKFLQPQYLHKLGYKTQKQWVLECIEQLKNKLKELKKHE